jgi:hypothetical protein
MHRIEVMSPEVGPPNCLVCRRGNTPDAPDSMADFWAVDLERDVNWGDPAYVCKYCAADIGGLAGMVDAEQIGDLEAQIRQQRRKIHELETTLEQRERRLKTIVRGEKEKIRERREAKVKT